MSIERPTTEAHHPDVAVAQQEDDCKIFVSRIPSAFDQDTIRRLLEERLGGVGTVRDVSLVYPPRVEEQQQDDEELEGDQTKFPSHHNGDHQTPHRGFGFVILDSPEHQKEALAFETLRGGAKATSTKKHTIYLRPVVRMNINTNEATLTDLEKQACFLWANFRCPYGDDCKFHHTGDGGCLDRNETQNNKKGKCFAFKKGKCTRGVDCPYSHDCVVNKTKPQLIEGRSDSDKDCISWKTKGKCTKKDRCPYRHDLEVQKIALRKRERKRQPSTEKSREPLSIRVFGLNYDTTEADVRALLQNCGPIVEVTFPTFEDSGRSKGYCGVLFQSPKAVANAVELSGTELHGRWLSIQPGKMYLRQWEEHHKSRQDEHDMAPEVGEFGQKRKRRKTYGYAHN